MRTSRGLFGSSLDVTSGAWMHDIGGIGPGADSFYEYLYKTYVVFADAELWWVCLQQVDDRSSIPATGTCLRKRT